MAKRIRIAMLLSGYGTTMGNLLQKIDAGTLDAEIVLVVSNRADAYGLDRAEQANIPSAVVIRKECASREEFSEKIFALCREANVDLVCMGGFLQLVLVPDDFTNRVMNIHPSLIPAFCGKGFHGLRVHRAVLESGTKVSGCTVHFADNEYDHGPIILQKPVEVEDNDTPEKLMDRIAEQENLAYPEAIQLFAEGRLKVEGRRVKISGTTSGE